MKTVAIVGRGKTCQYAPFDKAEVDIWAFNDNAHTLYKEKRLNAAFEMHPDWMTAPRLEGVPGIPEYREWLKLPHNLPIYTHGIDRRIPASVAYPFEKINHIFRGTLFKGDIEVKNLYTSTTPYAIALAILQTYKRIELYGIELTQETEYKEHRDSVFFWMGRASAMGVQVHIHEDSKLYRPSLYPIMGINKP